MSALTGWLTALWNRQLPPQVRITHQVIWPLFVLPVALLNQLLTPHPVWLVLIVALGTMYGFGFYWVRSQATALTVTRKRLGSVLVAGDALREEFELRNESILPVLWAEFLDHSTVPGYNAGQVVACGASAAYRWNSAVECKQRGVYRLGPHTLVLDDPLGLFRLQLTATESEAVIIYPRVAHLPAVVLPFGDANGAARRRRPLWGALPSASVRDHQPTDSLRYVHWPRTARHGTLIVKELEIEPSGAVWLVLDLNGAVHRALAGRDTLEFAVIVAASLAAALLTANERRAVGLLTVSSGGADAEPLHSVVLPPQSGQAQLWRILAALAPVRATTVALAEQLRGAHSTLGPRGTTIVITPDVHATGVAAWTPELLHLQAMGVASSVVLITGAGEPDEAAQPVRALLTRYDLPVQPLSADLRLPAALTFRRTRKVVRSTPTGGVVTYEVEEEVG
jgi:uncharacterized protein (DUF58 family)